MDVAIKEFFNKIYENVYVVDTIEDAENLSENDLIVDFRPKKIENISINSIKYVDIIFSCDIFFYNNKKELINKYHFIAYGKSDCGYIMSKPKREQPLNLYGIKITIESNEENNDQLKYKNLLYGKSWPAVYNNNEAVKLAVGNLFESLAQKNDFWEKIVNKSL